MNKRYVVLNEHTLGIIRPEQPQWLEPLAATVDGYNPKNGMAVVSPLDTVRDATKEDFDKFRVDSKYHLE